LYSLFTTWQLRSAPRLDGMKSVYKMPAFAYNFVPDFINSLATSQNNMYVNYTSLLIQGFTM
jgi:hypothetical protein